MIGYLVCIFILSGMISVCHARRGDGLECYHCHDCADLDKALKEDENIEIESKNRYGLIIKTIAKNPKKAVVSDTKETKNKALDGHIEKEQKCKICFKDIYLEDLGNKTEGRVDRGCITYDDVLFRQEKLYEENLNEECFKDGNNIQRCICDEVDIGIDDEPCNGSRKAELSIAILLLLIAFGVFQLFC